jgi:hypothetical protein
MAVIFMTLGIPVFAWARHQSAPQQRIFSIGEAALALLLTVISLWAIYAFSHHLISIN